MIHAYVSPGNRKDATSYSLWLSPEHRAAANLRRTIARLSRRLGTPRFEPHVTLLGGITLRDKESYAMAERLARKLTATSLAIVGVAHESKYFRCVVLEVERSAPLRRAHARARRLFHPAAKNSFSPHVSLVYGRLRPERRERVAGDVASFVGARIPVEALELVETAGHPRAWRTAGRFPLS